MNAFWIDAAAREIRAVEYAGISDLRAMVGGWIEVAKAWPGGDVLYVDEEGLLKRREHFFRVHGREQPLGGNGVVVGREVDQDGRTADPAISVEQLRAEVAFVSRAQAEAWARGNASEPAVSIYVAGEPPRVLGRFGELFGQAPPKKQS